jgi:adenine/guanine phosphoribosyltransferase-like PRPP-binding protein
VGLECLAAAPIEAAQQIEAALAHCGAVRLEEADRLGRDWTDAWKLDREPDEALRAALGYMPSVLYLCVRPPLEACVALDWYQRPLEDDQGFEHTATGRMLNLAKYHGVEEARKDLARSMADVIRRHPTYREAAVVVSVPGSTSGSRFSVHLAREVAEEAGLPVVHGCPRQVTRPPAKAVEDDEPEAVLTERFYLPERFGHQTVCVVDDVFRRGRTMRAMAYAATAAGAVRCLGLAAARTLRSVA